MPYQKLIKVGDKSGLTHASAPGFHSSRACAESERLLVANTVLNKTLQTYETPAVVHSTIESEGYGERGVRPPSGALIIFSDLELNVVELRPPNMDESGKTRYPVLFHL